LASPILLKKGKVFVLDQRLLPNEIKYREIGSADDGFDAIARMIVRGAPLIGITAFYALAAEAARPRATADRLFQKAERLNSARPTAVNLNAAVAAFTSILKEHAGERDFGKKAMKAAAEFHQREVGASEAIGRHGAALIKKNSSILTYCNAGALAAPDFGTALSVIFEARRMKKVSRVYTCETRPYLQGMRLTAFELSAAKIPFRVICDNTAGFLMKKGMVDAVVVGADRIALNGDTANKIGTFTLAVLARHHGIPFYVAAPRTTIDSSIRDGSQIPIEERDDSELLKIAGKRVAPRGASGLYYGFDVTDASLITAVITEKGVVTPVNRTGLRKLLEAV